MAMNKRLLATDEQDAYFLKEMSGRVLWLTLNTPRKGNALSLGALKALKEALQDAYADKAVKVIVIANEGKIFCAGHDLQEMFDGDGPEEKRRAQREILESCTEMMMAIVHGDKPVIASVRGIAAAGGAQVVATCDLALATDTARFCTPGVNLGGFCTTPLIGVGRNMHRKHAMELALTGDMFDADEAARFGLINYAVPEDELQAKTEALAQKIATKSSEAIQQGKKAFYQQIDMPIEEAYRFGLEKMIEANVTEDARRGVKAFFEKQKPVWQDEE